MSQPNADMPQFEMGPADAQVEHAETSSAPIYRKQDLNVYTVMLLISLVALIWAIVLLAMNLSQY